MSASASGDSSVLAGANTVLLIMPFISGPSCSLTLVMPSPTSAPPKILVSSPISAAARTTHTVSGG